MVISFSIKTASAQSGLSERTLHKAIKERRLKVLRVGRRVLITTADLQDFLNGRIAKAAGGSK